MLLLTLYYLAIPTAKQDSNLDKTKMPCKTRYIGRPCEPGHSVPR